MIEEIFFSNENASPLSAGIVDGQGLVCGPLVIAANSQANEASGRLVSTAVSVTVSGVGSPVSVGGLYHRLPAVPGVTLGALALTSTYQTVIATPPPGLAAISFRYYTTQAVTCWIVNNDSAPCTITFRLTSGATVNTFNPGAVALAGTVAAANGFNGLNRVPALAPGDVLEAKLAAPPVVAGSIILRTMFRLLPLAV